MDICEKHWLDYVAAFGSLIAGFGSLVLGGGVLWVYWQQWKTQQKQLKATLAPKFEESFKQLNTVLADIADSFKVELKHIGAVHQLRNNAEMSLTKEIYSELNQLLDYLVEAQRLGRKKENPDADFAKLAQDEDNLLLKITTWNTTKMYKEHLNNS